MMQESVALKEWSLALRALQAGCQTMLLRKGGIVEETGAFDVVSDRFVLFPTFYHQDREILRPDYHEWLDSEETQRRSCVSISLYAEIVDVVSLTDPEILANLSPLTIWTTRYLEDRLLFKPEKPLTALVVRAFSIPTVSVDVLPEYGGCLSWISLSHPIDVSGRMPVLTDEAFNDARRQILDAVSPAVI